MKGGARKGGTMRTYRDQQIEDLYESLGNSSERAEALAKDLGISTSQGWYLTALEIIKKQQAGTQEAP